MPKTIEVDEEQFLRDTELRKTVANIMKNPKAALLVEQARKIVDPQAPTPRLEQEQLISEPLKAMQDKFDKFVDETKKEKAEREEKDRVAKLTADYEAGRKVLRSQKWTDDGIKKLEEFMEQKGILDHEIAAAAFEKLHPPATPVMPGGTGAWNFVDDIQTDTSADLKKLIESKGQSEPLVDKMAHEAILELRGQPRR